jgi:hypothetical protein
MFICVKNESISEVGVDAGGRLFVRPIETRFDQIFRTAMGVDWDEQKQALIVREPGDWTLRRWFEQILSAAADEYGVELLLTPSTEWIAVPPKAQQDMRKASDSDRLTRLLKGRKEADERYWQDFQLKQALADADRFWSDGKYADYVRVLASHRGLLSRAQLKRLSIAEKRSAG